MKQNKFNIQTDKPINKLSDKNFVEFHHLLCSGMTRIFIETYHHLITDRNKKKKKKKEK